ncbi:putative regulator of Ras-like GTPase activity (Roadblock/LC7/MglB family) [Lipingzhangella halophila]|uniref:Putative regulator of Ras-like GTPase activity (Roadblock/LC7/MglB family) n=1 Tax=Lipingzhangella halophila TaxID=1783352 RepID=A0A7W7RED0_9ACTN|nr:roadblock/LC7 domain-containing protein [Lipingzhangella halophila]MBB4930453.1 putative regulator of Ras-like GTPase activity (Roadblock/LC7/MglB family) [Lipingzhangella halophila]
MSDPNPITTTSRGLHWLLDNILDKTPGTREVLVLSRDGLKMCFTPGLGEDGADQLSAIAAGVQSLSLSASAEFGDGKGSGQAMLEFGGGLLLIVPASAGAHLAVLAEEDADVGLVGHNMNELVEQIGDYLTAAPRQPVCSGEPRP